MITIRLIPGFSDNYIWMLQLENSNQAVVVDPGDGSRLIPLLESESIDLVAVLITHQHIDHVGAVAKLVDRYPGLEVYGPKQSVVSNTRFGPEHPIPDLITQPLVEGDRMQIDALGLSFQVLAVPGHTLDHIAYYGHNMLFCGDTLFGCGCGRIMGGSKQQFETSLSKIASLPTDTQLYCAHEYTLDNIGFAKWVEPDNPDLLQRDDEAMAKQEQGIPTIPASLELELKTNPFLRYKVPAVRQAAEKYMGEKLRTDADVFAAIRAWKDREYD
ncbi:MAG: hydroxyacylglutathione hydrolase [Gammaproteobacteria bacterium]|nr:hydroxyacylglutathione hydrolase [Gammaproteobacteria bacterium]